jgi:hypothetical protein
VGAHSRGIVMRVNGNNSTESIEHALLTSTAGEGS